MSDALPALPDAAPRTLAGAFLCAGDRLVHFRGDFFRFDYAAGAYRRLEPEVLRSDLAECLAGLTYLEQGEARPYQPTRRRIDDVLDAMAAITQARVDGMPAWLDGGLRRPRPANVVAFRNGLLDVERWLAGDGLLVPPNPEWLSASVRPYAWQGSPAEPRGWLDFLRSVWPDDSGEIELLQEWMGYLLTSDTSAQKILLMIGPPRSGKGTIARVMAGLVGREAMAGPTLSGLAADFGLSPLIGKSLAVVADARLGSRADRGAIVERLLSISGEDWLTINRKYREPVTLRLPTRLVLATNEMPRLSDASGALASRCLPLVMRISYVGREDRTLDARLAAELPGIVAWAMEGLRRYRARGKFMVPAGGEAALGELREIVSPVQAFVRAECAVSPAARVAVQTLYRRWVRWCRRSGGTPSDVRTFGRELHAAVPAVWVGYAGSRGKRRRVYRGIALVGPG